MNRKSITQTQSKKNNKIQTKKDSQMKIVSTNITMKKWK